MFRLFSAQDTQSTKTQRLVKGILILAGALFLLWLIVWLLPGSEPPPVVSSDGAGTVAAPSDDSPPEFQLFTPGRIFVVLLLAGGLGYALYLNRTSDNAPTTPAPMQSLGHLPLTQDQQLKLVCCQDEVLLLGVSPNEITLLRTYPRSAFAEASPTDLEALAEVPSASNGAPLSGFADVLRQYTAYGRHA